MNETINPAELQSQLQQKSTIQLLDVRRQDDFATDPALIPGAVWHDPAEANSWAEQLNPEQPVVIYCARGGSVSKSTQETLRAKGLKVQYIEGGLAGWMENGGEVIPPK